MPQSMRKTVTTKLSLILFSKILWSISLILQYTQLILAKGGGGGGSSSSGSTSSTSSRGSSGFSSGSTSSRWVFWYYGPYGSRVCGNICIITFCILGILILAIIGWGIWRCVEIRLESKKAKKERIYSFNEEKYNNNEPPEQYSFSHLSNRIDHESATKNQSLPVYNQITAAPEPIFRYGKHKDASSEAAKASEIFTKMYPPQEILPPIEHYKHIRDLGGSKAWKFIEPSLPQKKWVKVEDNGRVIEFSTTSDTMIQANYPLFIPKLDTENQIGNDSNNLRQTQTYHNRHSFNYDLLLSSSSSSSTTPLSSDSVSIELPSTSYWPSQIESQSQSSPPAYSSTSNNIKGKSTDIILPSYNIETSPISNKKCDTIYNERQSILYKKSDQKSNKESKISNEVLHYFEIKVIANAKHTTIAIGLATKPYPSYRLPGWNLHSVGYHSDDGRKFQESFGGRDYGPQWGKKGDVIGCGYLPDTGFVFFTKNGKDLGTAFTGTRHIWFPTLGADGPCKIEVNFGDADKEFMWKPAIGHDVTG
ncbi:hypothetical protein G9A89_011559 [Geosiphon pyriformis]|nr:hypothetical protein G9A89_011559 [Geosiphon pyriformis]